MADELRFGVGSCSWSCSRACHHSVVASRWAGASAFSDFVFRIRIRIEYPVWRGDGYFCLRTRTYLHLFIIEGCAERTAIVPIREVHDTISDHAYLTAYLPIFFLGTGSDLTLLALVPLGLVHLSFRLRLLRRVVFDYLIPDSTTILYCLNIYVEYVRRDVRSAVVGTFWYWYWRGATRCGVCCHWNENEWNCYRYWVLVNQSVVSSMIDVEIRVCARARVCELTFVCGVSVDL